MIIALWALAATGWGAEPRGTWDVPAAPVPAAVQAGSTQTSYVRLEAPGAVPFADEIRSVSWVFDGTEQRGTLGSDGRYAYTWNAPKKTGTVNVGLNFDVGGTKQEGPRREVHVVAPPGEVSWDGAEAGCAIETACVALPAGTFVPLANGAQWSVRRRLEAPIADLNMAVRAEDGRMTAIGSAPRSFDSLVGASLCISPNACSIRTPQTLHERVDFLVDGVPLTDPLLLSVPVTPSTWWACWGTLITQSSAAAFVLFLAYGFHRPYRFAARPGGRFPAVYSTSVGARLRAMPAPQRRMGPRARGGVWWSDQRAYFDSEFSPLRRIAGAAVTIRLVRTAPSAGATIDAPCAWIKGNQKLRRTTTPFRNGFAAGDYEWETVPQVGEPLKRGYVYRLPNAAVKTVFVIE